MASALPSAKERVVGIPGFAGTKSRSDETTVFAFSEESGNNPQLMNEASKNGRYLIIEYKKNDGAYFYSDTA